MTPDKHNLAEPHSPEKRAKMVSLTKNEEVLAVKLLSDHAKLPERASAQAAGYDLFSAHDLTIPAGDKAIVPTDISMAVPAGLYGRVAPRSGLAVKHFIDVGAGVIDSDYRGPVGVVLFNFGKAPFEVKRGDRVAQLILERIASLPVLKVDDLDETVRGAGGFGSTGTAEVFVAETNA